ncbi:hypothetical protein [Planococcus sp. ISL-110]|nr:hypothetical protein [Planococcus sp. ISL-110]MBT2572179.1 hypothetical protein [Planococcus sp. ISL-110]
MGSADLSKREREHGFAVWRLFSDLEKGEADEEKFYAIVQKTVPDYQQ